MAGRAFFRNTDEHMNAGLMSLAGWLELEEDWTRPMDKVPMTAEGHAAMMDEVKHLKSVERPRIIKAIEEARSHGDLSENAEYHAAK